MFAKLVVFTFSIVVVLTSECPQKPSEPQLNGIYLEGYWYEFFQINDELNNNSCSHFQITCDNSSVCAVAHVVWESYILRTIYDAIIQQENDTVTLKTKDNSGDKELNITNINLRYGDDQVLLWSCEEDKLSKN